MRLPALLATSSSNSTFALVPALRRRYGDSAGLPRDKVAHVMPHAGAGPIAKARLAALWAREIFEVATASHDLCLREIDGVADTCGGVGYILSWTRHGNALLGHASSAWTFPHLRSRIMPHFHAMMLKTLFFVYFRFNMEYGS